MRPALFSDGTSKIVGGSQIYEVIKGRHRLEACRMLGFTNISCFIRHASDEEVLTLQIMSSRNQIQTKPYQYTQHLLRILSRNLEYNLDDLCDKLAVDPSFIIKRLGLFNLSKSCLAKVFTKEMCLVNAYELAKLQPKSEQDRFINDALTNNTLDFVCKVKDRIREFRNIKRSNFKRNKEMAREYLDGKQVRDFLTKIPRNHLFTVIFEKKDGTLRQMTGRRDVRAKLKGGKNSLKDCKHLQSLYDTGAEDYRCFDTNKVLILRGEGYELKVRNFDPANSRILTAAEVASG